MAQKLYHPFWRDRLILISSGIGLLANIILWLLFLSKFGRGAEVVPLHFNVISGIDLVGSAKRLYQIPAVGLMTLLINTFISRQVYDTGQILSYFLIFASVLVQTFLGIAAASILFLNS